MRWKIQNKLLENVNTFCFLLFVCVSAPPPPSRYHPPSAENRRSHLRQHVRQWRSQDGGDHHLDSCGGRAGFYYAHGAKEETEGAEAQKTQRWVAD